MRGGGFDKARLEARIAMVEGRFATAWFLLIGAAFGFLTGISAAVGPSWPLSFWGMGCAKVPTWEPWDSIAEQRERLAVG